MNKRAAIILGILAVAVLACFLMPVEFSTMLRKETLSAVGPTLRRADTPVTFLRRMNSKLKTLDQAQAEITDLRQKLAEVTLQNQILSDKAAENARLREMLGFREASPYRLLACRVVAREPSNWWATVQVDVGWADDPDLQKDQPVVSPRGVVGKTGTVSRDVTDVILLVNVNCSISATIQGTKEQGIVQGLGNFEEVKPRVKIKYLPKDSQVAVNQFVVTSGLGPYFPAGLQLGTIVDVPPLSKTYPTFGLYREATLEPTADLNNLDELFIVLGPKAGSGKSSSSSSSSELSEKPEPESKPDANATTTVPVQTTPVPSQ